MAKNSNYDYEETMVTLTDEDGVDRDFYIDEIYEVDGKTCQRFATSYRFTTLAK